MKITELENKINEFIKTYYEKYNYMYNVYYEFNYLENINNLNYLYKTRFKMMISFLQYLKKLKTTIFSDNIYCKDVETNLKVYVPPERLFTYFLEFSLFQKMSQHFEKIQIDIDENDTNLNFQKKLKIYGRHGYKKSINEIKKKLEKLLKCMYPLLIDLKSYSDNKLYINGRNQRNYS